MLGLLKETLLYGVFFICFYTFFSLWIGGFKDNKSKQALSLYMLGASIFFAISILKYQNYYEYYVYLESLYMGILLSAFPLLYIYVRSLLVKNWFHKKLLLHFIPVLFILVLASFLYFSLAYPEKIEFLRNSTNNHPDFSETAKKLNFVFELTTYIYLFQGIIYLGGIYRFYKKYKLKVRNLYSDDTVKELKQLEIIIFLILVIAATFIFSVNIIGLNEIWNNDPIAIAIGVFNIFSLGSLGFLGSKQQNLYAGETIIENCIQLSNGSNNELKTKLLAQFNEKKIFLKKDLTIWDVCRETNSNRTYISHLINSEFAMNFSCFVNKFRVDEAKSLLKNPNLAGLSLQAIAYKSGFNSLASFHRAFQRFENTSPGIFRGKQ